VPTFDELLETYEDPQDDLTPIEQHDPYWLKRDDPFEIAGVRGGKARLPTEPTTQPTLDPVGPQVPPARAAASAC